jgi:uncharacterized protein (DUF2235 family)
LETLDKGWQVSGFVRSLWNFEKVEIVGDLAFGSKDLFFLKSNIRIPYTFLSMQYVVGQVQKIFPFFFFFFEIFMFGHSKGS